MSQDYPVLTLAWSCWKGGGEREIEGEGEGERGGRERRGV